MGCGTGSLTIALTEARPDARVIGVDGDPAILRAAIGQATSAAQSQPTAGVRLPATSR